MSVSPDSDKSMCFRMAQIADALASALEKLLSETFSASDAPMFFSDFLLRCSSPILFSDAHHLLFPILNASYFEFRECLQEDHLEKMQVFFEFHKKQLWVLVWNSESVWSGYSPLDPIFCTKIATLSTCFQSLNRPKLAHHCEWFTPSLSSTRLRFLRLFSRCKRAVHTQCRASTPLYTWSSGSSLSAFLLFFKTPQDACNR